MTKIDGAQGDFDSGEVNMQISFAHGRNLCDVAEFISPAELDEKS